MRGKPGFIMFQNIDLNDKLIITLVGAAGTLIGLIAKGIWDFCNKTWDAKRKKNLWLVEKSIKHFLSWQKL